MIQFYEREVEEKDIFVRSGVLHGEGRLKAEIFTINPFKIVFYIVQSIFSQEEFAVKPEDIVEIE